MSGFGFAVHVLDIKRRELRRGPVRWTPIVRQPEPSLRCSPTDLSTGSDRGWCDNIASIFSLVNINAVVCRCAGGDGGAKAHPVGEADRPHIHRHSAS